MEPFVRVNIKHGEPERLNLRSWEEAFPGLSAGFTGRGGGTGTAPYESLNLALHVGDDPEAVIANRAKLAESAGFPFDAWTCGEQVHGTRIGVVDAEQRGRGRLDRTSSFEDTDGLITHVPGIMLTSFYADCVPLYFLDPVHHVVGLAHAGWKGTVQQIALQMIVKMEEEYGSRPDQIRTAIGPSIGPCCYEVDEHVMSRVRSIVSESEQQDLAAKVASASANPGKSMLNLKELNRIIMIKAGILPSHIECTTWCTSCSTDVFFSYRKENGITGRMASWIGMKER
ncbi:peptidoglycan editing factor PgeF [Paenibacillus sp. YPG26]|uniref:peptidoglycan editing factor PgeF n=1 Tax=Paenibacillus sp. YPG26 TaxID=2878915 RepID=UPI00203C5642|nr:peptidoglycan editing factor PgeF [Paenibacillus sp. YPG26]USB34513.1 peptidoglycan editing factor PgeF [Paenibacillus sp. YPG26]